MSIKFLIFVILMLLFVVLIVVGLFLIFVAKNLAVRFVRSRQRCGGVNMADYLTGVLGLFDATLRAMDTPLTLYGYTFSYWQVFIWVIVAGLIIWFIGRVIDA